MKIKICPKCGSRNLSVPTIAEIIIPGVAEMQGKYKCNSCNSVVFPIEIEEKDLKGLKSKLKKVQ